MVTIVEEELQPHAVGIIFAAGEAVVLGEGDMLGVVSGESLGHASSIIRTGIRSVPSAIGAPRQMPLCICWGEGSGWVILLVRSAGGFANKI
jgi:hypothetical protein